MGRLAPRGHMRLGSMTPHCTPMAGGKKKTHTHMCVCRRWLASGSHAHLLLPVQQLACHCYTGWFKEQTRTKALIVLPLHAALSSQTSYSVSVAMASHTMAKKCIQLPHGDMINRHSTCPCMNTNLACVAVGLPRHHMPTGKS